MFVSFATESVVRRRAQRVPDGLDWRDDWDDPIEDEIPGWTIQPIDSEETFDAAGGRTLSRWRALGPGNADVRAGDRIEWRGDEYEIDGEPLHRTSPSGRLTHCELILKRRGRA